jgi:hypothetical protein
MPLLEKNEKQVLVWVIIPLLLVFAASIVLLLLGKSDAAFDVSWYGTIAVFTVCICFIVFFDSKKRWPGATTWERWTNLITFRRG